VAVGVPPAVVVTGALAASGAAGVCAIATAGVARRVARAMGRAAGRVQESAKRVKHVMAICTTKAHASGFGPVRDNHVNSFTSKELQQTLPRCCGIANPTIVSGIFHKATFMSAELEIGSGAVARKVLCLK